MTIIENLPIKNADIPENWLSRLPIGDIPVVSSLTGSRGKVSDGRCKGWRNKTSIDKIENLLNDCSSPQHNK